MRIINVIEMIENNILGIESFGIFEEQLDNEVIDEANKLFLAKAKENGFDDEKFDGADIIEDGYYQNGNYSVNVVWSDI